METESTATATATATTTATTAHNTSEGNDTAPNSASTATDTSDPSSSTPVNKNSPETESSTAPVTSPAASGMPPKARRRGATPTPTPTPAPASTSTTSTSSTSPSESSPSAASSKKSRKLSSQQSPTQAAAMAAIHAATAANNAANATSTSLAINPANPPQITSTLSGAPHPHPNTAAGALAAAVANANAASLASATPPPSADDDGDETGDISSSGRGYLAQFFWKEHYNTTRASASDPVPRSTRPNQSEMVPSIPTMFHRVVSVLQEVEWDVTGIDILPLIDRKIVRPLSVRDKTFDKKLLLTSKTGVQYVVQACRKEHVKLLFEGAKGGLLGELGLCPQLIDVYSVSPGRRVCVGGVGPLVREKGVSTTKSTACICTAAEARLRAGLGGNSLPREVIAQANAENARAHYEDDSKANIKGRRTPVQGDGNGKITPIPGKAVNGVPAGMQYPEGDPMFGMDVSDDLLEDMNSLDSTDVDMNGGGRASTPLRGRPPNNPDVNTYRKRLAVQNKLVQHLQLQLKQEQEQSAAWRQKWNEEHDLNIRLWDRLNAFQRKLEKMSRPLSSWFYAYSGASTYRSYPLEPWDMENAEAAQAQAQAQAAAVAQAQYHSPSQ